MKNVFQSYPDLDTIYVVNGMPFLTEREADNYALKVKAKVEIVKRGEDASDESGEAVSAAKTPRSSGKTTRKTKG
jgi:hypothetical protein